ncbi:MAG TPA: hypothetical protein VF473_09315 [Cyclobacteriaceae bacterium]
MKKVMLVALVMMVSASVLSKNTHPVKVLSTAKEVVYFKVSPEMIGAIMEVYDENGHMIYNDTVTSKKMIVDFYAEPTGSYTIHIKKNGADEVIEYVKK